MQAFRSFDVMTVPGLHSSGPGHWQSRWEDRHPEFRRVIQKNWSAPDLDAWSECINAEAGKTNQPILLVAHSFGCLASVYGTAGRRTDIAGALFIAPADPEKFGLTERLLAGALSYPSIMIASVNDPWMKAERAAFWAREWGSIFIDAGELGHINADSGLGDWDFGLQQLERLARIACCRKITCVPL